MQENIILELIPTSSNPITGEIAQISALKIKGIELVSRFDYRLNPAKIKIHDFVNMLSYDKDNFTYVNHSKEIVDKFKEWAKNNKIFVMDTSYTKAYLNHYGISNETVLIFELLNLKPSKTIIQDLMQKYKLQPSNHIVDLLYESLIYESNDLIAKNGEEE